MADSAVPEERWKDQFEIQEPVRSAQIGAELLLGSARRGNYLGRDQNRCKHIEFEDISKIRERVASWDYTGLQDIRIWKRRLLEMRHKTLAIHDESRGGLG